MSISMRLLTENKTITLFRLEHKDGSGIYFNRDGSMKSIPTIRFNDHGLYAFVNINRFAEPSYVGFYNCEDYLLYKILVSDALVYRTGQAIFNPNDVISKNIISKPSLADI